MAIYKKIYIFDIAPIWTREYKNYQSRNKVWSNATGLCQTLHSKATPIFILLLCVGVSLFNG